MIEHSVFVIGGLKDEQISLIQSEANEVCCLICITRGEQHKVYAPDFFEALCMVRLHILEPMSLIPFCYGASLDVWPSDADRDTARGLKAHKIDQNGLTSDPVDIFDSGHDLMPAILAVQEDYARDWIGSSPGTAYSAPERRALSALQRLRRFLPLRLPGRAR